MPVKGCQRDMKNKLKKMFIVETEGIGVVEIILILVVLIGLVVIFRTEINTIIQNLFSKIKTSISTFT